METSVLRHHHHNAANASTLNCSSVTATTKCYDSLPKHSGTPLSTKKHPTETKPFEFSESRRVRVKECCSSLYKAHGSGIQHRDEDPSAFESEFAIENFVDVNHARSRAARCLTFSSPLTEEEFFDADQVCFSAESSPVQIASVADCSLQESTDLELDSSDNSILFQGATDDERDVNLQRENADFLKAEDQKKFKFEKAHAMYRRIFRHH